MEEVPDAIGLNHVGVGVRKHLELESDGLNGPLCASKAVNAYGQDFGVETGNGFVVFLQLNELPPAVSSPEPPVEDQHNVPVAGI